MSVQASKKTIEISWIYVSIKMILARILDGAFSQVIESLCVMALVALQNDLLQIKTLGETQEIKFSQFSNL